LLLLYYITLYCIILYYYIIDNDGQEVFEKTHLQLSIKQFNEC